MKVLLKIILSILVFSFISSQQSFKEIEYRQKIVSKYDKQFTLFSVKFIRDKGIQAQYQKGISKIEFDPDTSSFVDKTGDEGLKTFELTNEELDLKPINELFEEFDKIEFPEETNFSSSLFPDFPIWHIIVDGKDYQSNINTDFYDKFNELVQIKKIEKHVIKKYNNSKVLLNSFEKN